MSQPIQEPLPGGGASAGDDTAAEPLSSEQRSRVLSAVRLKLSLTVFVVTVLIALSAMIFVGVSQIFTWLTPTIRQDLQRKAQRGAIELAQTTQLGMVVHDEHAIAIAAADYMQDKDVIGLVVEGGKGEALFRHGSELPYLDALYAQPRGTVHDLGPAYGAWMSSAIESVTVGRVALVISKERLEAGMQLRQEVLALGALGCLIALVLCLLFFNFYIGPILRVTGEAFLRLERTTEAALAATRLKSQFLANMSHEIRTPMNGIMGVLDLLNRTALSAKQQRHMQTIETSARVLLTIIDDVLDFSKLEAGKVTLRYDDFEVRQVAQEVVELLSPKAHTKGIEIVLRVDPAVPYSLYGDVDRVKQILTNLVGNSVKFTETGHVQLRVLLAAGAPSGLATDVAVSASASSSAPAMFVRFAVEDTGMGISAEDQAKLFGVFSQVDGSLTRKHGGTGLGLAICKRLAEAMGGQIGVDSERGKGSTFWFTIATREGSLVPAEPGAPARPARVLLVSKDDAQGAMLSELVSRWGMSCVLASDTQQACSLIIDCDPRPFDVAIVDGSFDRTQEWGRTLFDLCTGENLPLVRMLSTLQIADARDNAEREICITKPVRASELYNGLVALLDGVPIVQRGRRINSDPANLTGGVRARNATILVVDDNETNRLVAVELLAELGYAADTACNGQEAVEQVQRSEYGAVLMDCQMPVMDGYEATRQIRALPEPLCKLPIIALTAHAMAGDRDKVLEAGMDDYTAKPVRARALDRVLMRWVKVDRAQAEAVTAAARMGGRSSTIPPAAPALSVEDLTATQVLDPSLPRSSKVVELFLRVVPSLMDSLSAAVTSGDPEPVRQLAHKLKGNCLSLGASQLAAACNVIEQAASQGVVEVAAHARLPEYFAQLRPLLERSAGSVSSVAPPS